MTRLPALLVRILPSNVLTRLLTVLDEEASLCACPLERGVMQALAKSIRVRLD